MSSIGTRSGRLPGGAKFIEVGVLQAVGADVMKKELMNKLRIVTAAIACAVVLATQAHAQISGTAFTQWDFQSSDLPSTGGPAGNTPVAAIAIVDMPVDFVNYGGAASVGSGTATGFHASAATQWHGTVGNGSTKSLSSNNWAIGDYYQFQTSTLGVMDTALGFAFDQLSSNTGPRDFKLQYSTDNSIYTDLVDGDYAMVGGSWSSGTNVPLTHTYGFNLPDSLLNLPNVYVRLAVTGTTSVNGGTIGTGGASRIDNVGFYEDFDFTGAGPPELPATGDIVFALSTSSSASTLELVRENESMDGGMKVGTSSPWTSQNFIHGVKFDNFGGTRHNVNGNLLAYDKGFVTVDEEENPVIVTGEIYSMATRSTGSFPDDPLPAAQLIGTTNGTGGAGVTLSRISGLSVNPNNSRIALAANDTGKVLVYDYQPGNSFGSGASLSNARETSTAPLAMNSDPIEHEMGTAWLNDSTVLAFSSTGQLFSVNESTMVSSQVANVPVTVLGGEESFNTALAYNPDVSPYVFALYSSFLGTGLTELHILDPNNSYNVVNSVDLSADTRQGLDLALDANGDLYVSRFSGVISLLADAAANAATIGDNTDEIWYDSSTFAESGGLAIGYAPPAGGLQGDYNGDGFVDAVDYTVWRNNLGAGDESSINDNGDGMNGVDANDYTLWKSQYGEGVPPGSGAGGLAPVPEPTSVLLLLAGVVGALACGRRK
jgi:hypothetical protein